jgi:hypothetical protein
LQREERIVTVVLDGKAFQNISATPPSFKLNGGLYQLSVAGGTITAGSVELQTLGPDNATFLSMPTPIKLTASPGTFQGNVPPGQYQLTCAGCSGINVSVAAIPN